MPSYYRVDGLVRVGRNFDGKPILSAAQIEDIVAYLATLRDRTHESMPAHDAPTIPGLAGGAAVAGAIPIVTLRPLEATPAMLTAAIRNVVGEAPVRTGKVKLDMPPLVENGNTVPMTVERRRAR